MTSFYQQKLVNRVQKLHCAPVTDKWWENFRKELWAQFANDNLTVCSDFFVTLTIIMHLFFFTVCSDGQCDSPSPKASAATKWRWGVAMLLKKFSKKRHVGLKFSMMVKNTLNKTPESSMLSKFAQTHHPPLRSS